MKTDVVLVAAAIIGLTSAVVLDYYDGSPCTTKKNEDGICKKLLDCPSSIAIVKNRKTLSQIPKLFFRCGFIEMDELICCPNTDLSPTPTTPTTPTINQKIKIRQSEKECMSYKQLFADQPGIIIPHIFYGVEALDGEFPHMAALGYRKNFDCGGTIISKRYILTAGHCIVKLDNNPPTVARIGVNIMSTAVADDDYDIENIIVHPEYKRSSKYHDIALVKLARDIEFTERKKPACLYTGTEEPQGVITVSGWGTTENSTADEFSDVLLKANMKLTANTECREKYMKQATKSLLDGIVSTQICARGASNNSDTCLGDSGGPIQYYDEDVKVYRVIGVTSFGRTCGGKTPGVYTKVSSYLDWIEGHVWS